MTFSQVPAGASIFIDANVLIYHFTSEQQYGPACTQLMRRIEHREVAGVTSAHVLADVAHRLMTLEAMASFGWPPNSIAARIRKHHAEIPRLQAFAAAIASIRRLGIQVMSSTQSLVEAAIALCPQYELMMGDALLLASMQASGVTNLASNDADFDRVPGITRYAPG